jgi:hypothetical protein
LRFNNIHFRLAPRRGVRNGEGEGNGPRSVLIFHSQTDYSFGRPEKLKGSRFNTPEDLAAFSQKFDEGIKKVFSNDQGIQFVKFGPPRDNDPKCGIKAGRFMLTG